MSSATSNDKPTFFTVIIRDDCLRHLQIPSAFSSDYGSILPRRITIRTEDARTWPVTYERALACKDGDVEYFYFTEGWNNVVVYTKLQKKEFLVFTQISGSMFDMVVYRSDGCNRLISSSVGAKDPPTSFWGIYMDRFISQMYVPISFEREHEEFQWLASITLQTSDGGSWDVKLKRKRYGSELFLKDGWTGFVQDNKIGHEYFLIFHYLPESKGFLVSIYNRNGVLTDRNREQYGDHPHTYDHGAGQRGVGPSMPADSQLKFVLKLNDACTRLKRVDVPKSLAAALGIHTGEGSFRLENEQGRQWTVYLRARRNNQTDVRYSIKDGWSAFMIENNFVVGDILLFQCIPFEAVKVLKMAHAEGMQLLDRAGKGGVI